MAEEKGTESTIRTLAICYSRKLLTSPVLPKGQGSGLCEPRITLNQPQAHCTCHRCSYEQR